MKKKKMKKEEIIDTPKEVKQTIIKTLEEGLGDKMIVVKEKKSRQ